MQTNFLGGTYVFAHNSVKIFVTNMQNQHEQLIFDHFHNKNVFGTHKICTQSIGYKFVLYGELKDYFKQRKTNTLTKPVAKNHAKGVNK